MTAGIAPGHSRDAELAPFTVNDIFLVRGALGHPLYGMFSPGDVTVQPDQVSLEVLMALDEFFTDANRDDILLIYYSGHGRLDETGQLFLCTRDTKMSRLRSTAVGSRRLNEMIEASPARPCFRSSGSAEWVGVAALVNDGLVYALPRPRSVGSDDRAAAAR
jgi:hypothetical protein